MTNYKHIGTASTTLEALHLAGDLLLEMVDKTRKVNKEHSLVLRTQPHNDGGLSIEATDIAECEENAAFVQHDPNALVYIHTHKVTTCASRAVPSPQDLRQILTCALPDRNGDAPAEAYGILISTTPGQGEVTTYLPLPDARLPSRKKWDGIFKKTPLKKEEIHALLQSVGIGQSRSRQVYVRAEQLLRSWGFPTCIRPYANHPLDGIVLPTTPPYDTYLLEERILMENMW